MKENSLISCYAYCFIFFVTAISVLVSCEDILKVDLPKSLATTELVFGDDVLATAATKGMYAYMLGQSGFASGDNRSIVALAGLSADELDNYYNSLDYYVFEENSLLPKDALVLNAWQSMYKSIYDANLIMEGLSRSSGITKSTMDQLMGEALFIRAFCHFYLVNLFGRVPIITSSDYRINALIPRSDTDAVYDQITKDLEKARALLPLTYEGEEKVRPNKGAVMAFLARVYLYRRNWAQAEVYSSEVIEDKDRYKLCEDLNAVFLANSTEAIWQLSLPPNLTVSTYEGYYFNITEAGDLRNNVLRDGFVSAFEPADQRLTNWTRSYDTGSGVVYYPYKYKIKTKASAISPTEYSMVLRLAEQYLIRAEARAYRGELPGAIEDIDVIRKRAGLPLIAINNPSISKEDLLLAIEHERHTELFTEWGHRWFDLKRTNRADAVLDPIKMVWQAQAVLYPVPQSEIDKNRNLLPQNPGY